MTDSQTKPTATGRGPLKQQTIVCPVEISGASLFHGYESRLRLLPSAPNTGVVFRRIDGSSPVDIPATVGYVRKVPRRTVIGKGSIQVQTIEHIMAALAGLQIDNCVVEINCPEVPGLDGSCRAFCDAILEAGVQQQDSAPREVIVNRAFRVGASRGRQSLAAKPYLMACCAVTYHFDYGPGSTIAPQQYSAEISPDVFYHEISAARTFVLETEIRMLKKLGFGGHLTYRDLVVIGAEGPIDNAFRWADECVRHKILDCVGDFALCGGRIQGHFTALRTGHHLNHEMAGFLTMISTEERRQKTVAA